MCIRRCPCCCTAGSADADTHSSPRACARTEAPVPRGSIPRASSDRRFPCCRRAFPVTPVVPGPSVVHPRSGKECRACSAAPCRRFRRRALSVVSTLPSAQVAAHPRTYSSRSLGTGTQSCAPDPTRSAAPPGYDHVRVGTPPGVHEWLGERDQRLRGGPFARRLRRDRHQRRGARIAAAHRCPRGGRRAVPVRGGGGQDPVRGLALGLGAHRHQAARRGRRGGAAGR